MDALSSQRVWVKGLLQTPFIKHSLSAKEGTCRSPVPTPDRQYVYMSVDQQRSSLFGAGEIAIKSQKPSLY